MPTSVYNLDTIVFVKQYKEYFRFAIIWDEVPAMVEIAIFWFQIHITNGLNSLHRKWHTGNQYMVKSADNWMRSNLELLPVMNVKKLLKIAVCSSPLNIYHGTDNIIKQSFISSSSCSSMGMGPLICPLFEESLDPPPVYFEKKL